MLFSSLLFLWLFLPFTFLTYQFIDNKYKNAFLLIMSLIFYSWGEPYFILLMLFSIVINYFFGIAVSTNSKIKAVCLFVCVVTNIGILGYYKYYNLIADVINNLLRRNAIHLKDIILPIGISFYTFQILSYVVDVYRGTVKPQKNIIHLALYISFFPQLIAGPIVKYSDINKQIEQRTTTVENISYGIQRFFIGLGKKIILSNSVAQIVDKIFSLPVNELSTGIAWAGAIFYSLQIYYDFSGYSDMAIGLGNMFGFTLHENFNYPYIAVSIQDFWRRWHISLSSWFKDYVYIPLGGNRKGVIHTYINLLIVFFCTGVWHGANYTFIIWGLFHGLFMIIERLFFSRILKKIKCNVINHLYVMIVVIVGWVIFRADTLQYAISYIQTMFSITKSEVWHMSEIINIKSTIMACCGILFCGLLQSNDRIWERVRRAYSKSIVLMCLSLILVGVYCILSLVGGAYNPFIYFRF